MARKRIFSNQRKTLKRVFHSYGTGEFEKMQAKELATKDEWEGLKSAKEGKAGELAWITMGGRHIPIRKKDLKAYQTRKKIK
jgi:hypothetical protein